MPVWKRGGGRDGLRGLGGGLRGWCWWRGRPGGGLGLRGGRGGLCVGSELGRRGERGLLGLFGGLVYWEGKRD